MDRSSLIKIINGVLNPEGFRRKGNYWVLNSPEIVKIANLQKSQFSNRYYLNYGYVIRSLPLTTRMHIYHRLSSSDSEENKRIDLLLDLDNPLSDEQRGAQLTEVLVKNLLPELKGIDNESDLLLELRSKAHLNDVPIIVKEHFGLPVE